MSRNKLQEVLDCLILTMPLEEKQKKYITMHFGTTDVETVLETTAVSKSILVMEAYRGK